MESIFSLAARRTSPTEGTPKVRGRAGELKMYWTKPWSGPPAMGIESGSQSQGKAGDVREERVSAARERIIKGTTGLCDTSVGAELRERRRAKRFGNAVPAAWSSRANRKLAAET